MFSFSHRLRGLKLLGGVSLGVLMLAAPVRAQEDTQDSGPVQLGPVTVNDNADRNALNHAPPVSTMPS
ncbi:MAG TPA: hypothetical protein VG501_05570, partial [Rhizomicrobium sp.]|nr:hypothetical protein [Rhizomicrobium sp.]